MNISIVTLALILMILAFVARFITIPFVSNYCFWFMTAGAVLLAWRISGM